jgi:hypothetical protein
MRKILTALVAASAIAAAAVPTSNMAEAAWGGWHGGWHGGGWGPGPFFGGLAAGAIIGGALAAPYYYPYPNGYYGYYAPPPYSGAPCVWRQVWNGYAWVRACV